MGYEVVLYLTADDTTRGYFHRFQKVEIRDRLWEVQMVDDITSETMLIVYLKETFTNEFEDAAADDSSDATEDTSTETAAITGKDSLYPFDSATYSIDESMATGTWSLSNNKAVIDNQTPAAASITVTSTKSGSVDLIYSRENEEDIVKTITIKSL